ncbi:HAD hydrolase, family IIID [Cryptococcus neoformans]|nr:HAD hydrolase, family IIID [Cryptococcus neoformans var. grubii]
MSQDEPTGCRSPSCSEPHLHSDTTGNNLSAQDSSSEALEEGMKTVNARSDAETAASGKRVKVFHTSNTEEEQARRHKALGNEAVMAREDETGAEEKEKSINDEDASTTAFSAIINQRDQGDGDLADYSDNVNMDDGDESPQVSTVPLAEEADEEWWDLKMQWGGKVYDIHVGGNDMVYDFREKIASLTSIPPDAQKLIGLSPTVKGKLNASHDAMRFAHLGVKKGGKFVLVGTKVEERFVDPIKEQEGEGGEGEFDVDYKGIGPGNDPRNKRKIQEIIEKVPITVMNAPREGKKLLVLDLDYTIVDTKPLLSGTLPSSECARPGLHDFLELVYPHYDIVIWSQTSWRWLETKLIELDLFSDSRGYKISFVIDRTCMFPELKVFSQRNGQPYKHEVKPLAYLWASFPQWSAKNTIHIDDLSRNFALNPGEGLKIRAFNKAGSPDGRRDRELIKLGTYLIGIAASQRDFTTVNHKYWNGRVKGRRGRH